jgi:hypothetical protein
MVSNVVNPHHLDADPDPGFFFKADPDANPDFNKMRILPAISRTMF